jgi:hypothetical protein
MTWMVTSLYPDQAWDSSDDEDGLDFADREDKTITACPFFPFLLEANRPRIPPWLISLYVPGASALAMLSPSPPAQRERRRLRKSHVHSTTTLTDKRSGAGDKSRSEQYQRDGSKGDSPSFHITNDCSQYLTVIRRTPAGVPNNIPRAIKPPGHQVRASFSSTWTGIFRSHQLSKFVFNT